MKNLLLSLFATSLLVLASCEKEQIPQPDPIVNLLNDEEPQSLVDTMAATFFDNPMTVEVTATADAVIEDYPTFIDYDPFTSAVVRRTGSVDSCVRGIELTASEKERLTKAFLAKIDCQKANKATIASIHRNIEFWAKTWKEDMWKNWYLPQKADLDDKLKRGLITEREYKDKIASLNTQWESKMKWHNGQVKEKIKKDLKRAEVCGKIKDCEKIYLESVMSILGKGKYKKWISCYKYHYKNRK